MTKRIYGALALDVPSGFDDESVVILKAPAATPAVKMRAPSGEARRPTLVVRRVSLASDASLTELVDAEERALTGAVPGLAFTERTAHTVGGLDAVVRELTIPAPDGTVRQVHVSVRANAALYVFVATALDDLEFASTRATLLSVVDSARFD